MILDPTRYSETPVRELLQAAAYGRVGVDQRFIQAIVGRGAEGARDVLAFTRENHDRDPIEIDGVLVDLLRYFGSEEAPDEALAFYIDVLRRDPSDVDDQMVLALLPFGARAVAPLIALYEEVGEEQASDVAFVLAGLQLRDERILSLLLDRLQFDAADGAFLLGLYGDPAAKEPLEAMLAEVPEDDAELRREITFALSELGREIEPYKPEPFDILKEYPKRDTPMMEALKHSERLELLGHADAETRAAAAYSFFNQDNNAETRKRLIEVARNDAEPSVRGRAWASVADAASEGKDADAIRDQMIAVVNDASRPVEERGGAAIGLYGVAEHPAAMEAIEKLYAEGGRARVRALEAMWRSLYPPFAKHFAKHLEDADVSIVRHALRGAGYFKLTQSIDKIASYFDREDDFEDLREDALFAYAMAMPGETSRGRAKGMLRKIDEIAELAPDEVELVQFAIDERLQLAGLKPVFSVEEEHEHHHHAEAQPQIAPPPAPASGKVGRNDPCPCGSGKKYKKCHGA